MAPRAEGLGINGGGNAHVLALAGGSACTTREHTKPSYLTTVGLRHTFYPTKSCTKKEK